MQRSALCTPLPNLHTMINGRSAPNSNEAVAMALGLRLANPLGKR
jgi:hypothetical protein